MKKIFLYSFMALALAGFTSCGDDELTDSRLTYYAVLELQGDDFVTVPVGTSYTDAGCKATLGGEDFTSSIVTTGVEDVDVNQLGFYEITYKATNADGFESSVSRTVCVYDPSVTISMDGSYSTDMGATTYGAAATPFATYAAYYGNTSQCSGITFTEEVPGIYAVNDLFAGWYAQIRGYGNNYAMTGYVSLDNDGNIELLDSYIRGWGDGLDYLDGGKYDAEAGTISYSVSYAGVIFMNIVLNKD